MVDRIKNIISAVEKFSNDSLSKKVGRRKVALENNFEIIHNVVNGGFINTIYERNQIKQVWLILDENDVLLHGLDFKRGNAFPDDYMSDWRISNGKLYYYAHSSMRGDVVDICIELRDTDKILKE